MSEIQRRPFLVRPGEGVSVWSLGGRFTVKVNDQAAQGRFSILDGKMTFFIGDEVLEATTGTFVLAPMGVPHTFTVDVEPTRVLVFASPAGFERFALELGEPAANDEPPLDLAVPGPDVLGPVAERYGIEVVGPPRRAQA